MQRTIKSINIIGTIDDKTDANHDVYIELTDGEKYSGTFFTLANIQRLMDCYRETSSDCNGGSFFWASEMCIVREIDEQLIRDTAQTMLEEGYFEKAFLRVSSQD